MYRAHYGLVFVRCQILFLNLAMAFGSVKLCSMMEAIGEVVVGDLQAIALIRWECGLFLDEGILADYFGRQACRKDHVLLEDDLETLANSLAPWVDAQEGVGGCREETNSSDAVQTAADEFISAPACAFGENYSAAATAPSPHVEGLEQVNPVECKRECYDDWLCDALGINTKYNTVTNESDKNPDYTT